MGHAMRAPAPRGTRLNPANRPPLGPGLPTCCSMRLLQGILTTLPFTLAVYMVRDFEAEGGRPPSEATVGRLTGLLAAVFCAAQLVTSYPWGIISDRVGRKVGRAACRSAAWRGRAVSLWSRFFRVMGTPQCCCAHFAQ